MPAVPGDTFLLTGGKVPSPHLWAILWGPAGAADAFLAVMLTTARPHTDPTCILDVGDHPFIRHPTSVDYGGCSRWPAEKLRDHIANGVAKPRQGLDAAVLERIREGFWQSPRLPHALRRMAVEEFGATGPEGSPPSSAPL